MSRGPTIRAAAAAVLTAAGMLLLMVGEPRLGTGSGGGVSAGGGLTGPGGTQGAWPYAPAAVAVAAASGAWALGYVAYRWGLDRRRRRGEPEEVYVVERPPAPWWLPLALGAVLLAVVAALYAGASGRWGAGFEATAVRMPPLSAELPPASGLHPAGTARADEALRGPGRGSGVRLAGVLPWLLAVLAMAVMAVPMAGALGRRRAVPAPPDRAGLSPPPVLQPPRGATAMSGGEFERRVTAIAAMADPRQAVRASFHLFVEASTAPGKAPDPALTPSERVAWGVPEGLGCSPQAQRLLQLYHEAAYGPRETTAAQQAEAVAVLRELRPWLEKVRPCPR